MYAVCRWYIAVWSDCSTKSYYISALFVDIGSTHVYNGSNVSHAVHHFNEASLIIRGAAQLAGKRER